MIEPRFLLGRHLYHIHQRPKLLLLRGQMLVMLDMIVLALNVGEVRLAQIGLAMLRSGVGIFPGSGLVDVNCTGILAP